ncbi:MAG: phosphotransferase [Chromatiaceae bacterium]|nr:phosphotransferase [Candidatus Thioaporhodococcus sediminis]
MPERRALLEDWLKAVLDRGEITLTPASGDASFRRYWRIALEGQTYIAMDAPPGVEDTGRFVRIARDWRALGLRTPAIHAEDADQGFLLLEDFGRRLYLEALHADSADRLYGDALGALAIIQACAPTRDLPAYDAPFLRRELDLFRHWLVERYLGLTLSSDEEADLEEGLALLIASALEQPRVCVHRDYHSRNLMITPSPSPGILDFQDAVAGPVTYDLVSLLRDCYIAWPRARVEEWAWGYFGLAVQSGILRPEQEVDFPRWFDLMGVQRHLKASGIFARLQIRDGKPGYLGDIPRTLGYVLEVAPAYAPLRGVAALIAGRVLPALSVATSRAATT